MTIKNTSQKVINIGTTILMPDKEMEATKAITEAPSIKAMVERGQLSIIDEKTDKEKKAEEAKRKAEEATKKRSAEVTAKAAEEAKRKAEAVARETGGNK